MFKANKTLINVLQVSAGVQEFSYERPHESLSVWLKSNPNLKYLTVCFLPLQEAYIADLDAKSGASLKLTILNPRGRIWTMVAGGGASVVYRFADE